MRRLITRDFWEGLSEFRLSTAHGGIVILAVHDLA